MKYLGLWNCSRPDGSLWLPRGAFQPCGDCLREREGDGLKSPPRSGHDPGPIHAGRQLGHELPELDDRCPARNPLVGAGAGQTWYRWSSRRASSAWSPFKYLLYPYIHIQPPGAGMAGARTWDARAARVVCSNREFGGICRDRCPYLPRSPAPPVRMISHGTPDV